MHRCQWPVLLIKRCDRRREEIKRFDRLCPAGTSLEHGNLCLIGGASSEAKDGSLGVRNLSVGSAGPCMVASLSVREASVTLCNIMGSTLKVLSCFASCTLSKSRQQRSWRGNCLMLTSLMLHCSTSCNFTTRAILPISEDTLGQDSRSLIRLSTFRN